MIYYSYQTLPVPIVGTVGQTVSLAGILAQEFGPNYGGYTEFYLSYFGQQAINTFNGGNPPLSYWTATQSNFGTNAAGTATQWLKADGTAIQASEITQLWPANNLLSDITKPNVAHVTANNIDQYSLQIGSDIGPLAYISVPISYDQNHQPIDVIQYSITTIDPSLVSPHITNGAPTPADIVATAYKFAAKYPHAVSDADCTFIADDVAAAAGAPLADATASPVPSYNIEAGFWRIAYRGSDAASPLSSWSTKCQPGDIVRFQHTAGYNQDQATADAHMFTVLAVGPGNGTNMALTVYDNGVLIPGQHNEIGIHTDQDANGNYYDQLSYAPSVTIYRLDPSHQSLINAFDAGIDPNAPSVEHLDGTRYNDKIIGSQFDDLVNGSTGNDVINGGMGNNTLDYSWDGAGITVDLQQGKVNKGQYWVTNADFPYQVDNGTDTVSGFRHFIGGSGADTFKSVADLLNTFTFDGGTGTDTLDYSWDKYGITVDVANQSVGKGSQPVGSGKLPLGTDKFTGIEQFIGGAGNDKFIPDYFHHSFLAGGTGDDTLDYSSLKVGLTIDLQNGSVTKGSGPVVNGPAVPPVDNFTGIENLIGGSGNDVLTNAPGVSHTFDGGTGSDTVVFHGLHTNYSQSAYFDLDHRLHTVVSSSWQFADGPIDLVNVEHLQFWDGTYDVPGLSLSRAGSASSSLLAGKADSSIASPPTGLYPMDPADITKILGDHWHLAAF